MKVQFSVSRGAVAAAAIAVAGFAVVQYAPGATGATNPKHPILVIDVHEITMESKLGQDIHRQLNAYEEKVQADLGTEGQTLQNEMQGLQQQPSSPDRDKKMQALQAKETAYRQKLQARQSLVQGGELVARQKYWTDVSTIVEAIMAERGADAVVQKSSIVASVGGLDVTHDVIERLDRKDSNFKVPLVNPPASSVVPLMH